MSKTLAVGLVAAVIAFSGYPLNTAFAQGGAIPECTKTGSPGNGTICCDAPDGKGGVKQRCRPRQRGE